MPMLPPDFYEPSKYLTYPTEWPTHRLRWEVWTGTRWEPMIYVQRSPYPHRVVRSVHDEIVVGELDPLLHSRGCSKPRFKVRQCL